MGKRRKSGRLGRAAITAAAALLINACLAGVPSVRAEGAFRLLNGFESQDAAAFFRALNEAEITVTSGEEALVGNQSVQITKPDGSPEWEFAVGNDALPARENYDGLVFRLKTNLKQGNIFKVLDDGDSRSETSGSGALFYDKNGELLEQGHDTSWKAYTMPTDDFDGYVFIPFGDFDKDTAFDNGKIAFGMVNAADGSVLIVDNIGYYTGTDFTTLIEEIGSTIQEEEDTQNAPMELTAIDASSEEPGNEGYTDGSGPEAGVKENAVDGRTDDPAGKGFWHTQYSGGQDTRGQMGFITIQLGNAPSYRIDRLWSVGGRGISTETTIFTSLDNETYTPVPADNVEQEGNTFAFVEPLVAKYIKIQTKGDGDYISVQEIYMHEIGQESEEDYQNTSLTGLYSFETEESAFTLTDGDAANPASAQLSRQKVGGLIGNASLRIDIDNPGSWVYVNTPAFQPEEGATYSGIALRIKAAGSGRNAIFKMFTEEPRQEFWKNGWLVTKDGVKTAAPEDDNWKGVLLPGSFDGYVVIPFTGDFDASGAFSIKMGFVGDAWEGATVLVDNISLYSGVSVSKIVDEIDAFDAEVEEASYQPVKTTENTAIYFDFEEDQPFISSDPQVSISRQTEEALTGGASQVISIANNSSWVNYGLANVQGVAGYDGFIIRLKTSAPEGAIFKIFCDGDFGRSEFGIDVKLFTKGGRDVTPEDAAGMSGGWMGFVLPETFDGWMFIPFAGDHKASTGVTFDPTSKYTMNFGYVGSWTDTVTYMDEIGYYKGTAYDAIVKELGYEFTYDDGPMPDPTPDTDEENDVILTGLTGNPFSTTAYLTVFTGAPGESDSRVAQYFGEGTEALKGYTLVTRNVKGELIEPTGVMVVKIGVPQGEDPYRYTLFTTKNGRITPIELSVDGTYLSYYTRVLEPVILAKLPYSMEDVLLDEDGNIRYQ